MDANIINARQTSLGIVGDNLPFINDIIDIVNATEDTKNIPWGTGSICTNSPSNPYWDTEFKYYQRFIEDSRILDQFGVFTEENTINPVTAFKSSQLQKTPVDHSPAGTIARLTGLTKYDAEGLLAVHQYQTFLAHYNPTTSAPLHTTSSLSFIFQQNSAQPSIIPQISYLVNKNPSISLSKVKLQGVSA